MFINNFYNDKEIILAIQKDDKAAFEFLFKSYYKGLVGYITTYTQDIQLSEDIVQHSFIKLWNNRNKLLIETSPKNYLYNIAYNRYIDLYRKKKREGDLIKELCLQNLRSNIEENKDVLEKRIDKLKKIIEHLPPRCKEVLYLNKQRGLDYKEIAEKLNISPRTVEEHIRIAFKKIRIGFKENILLFFLFKKKLMK
ncbi:RNA polymerase sigma factor [Thalassobellus suaedae]|uniref:RNA polymerase sigma-70 factor n=1 Tax=Thalassobellus suaedae TaxID=3074124 RepID=A0ABY9XST5_9FLAO|nr:RNA polymerase sigma-70 factor [Flavobacteriaceae bacterium HL-DH14]